MRKYTKTIKRRKTVKRRNRKSKSKLHGGTCTDTGQWKLAQFPITNAQIQQFTRNTTSPKDCVINAMQLIGMIDVTVANVMRNTVQGQRDGFTAPQIVGFFTSVYKCDFKFDPEPNFNQFANRIRECLTKSHVVFAGFTDQYGEQHVFLIGKNNANTLYYIDPQINTICDVQRDPNCSALFQNKQEYYLLESPYIQLTPTELAARGFVNIASDTSEPMDVIDPTDTNDPMDTSEPMDVIDPTDTNDPMDTSEPMDTSM
jgi:hypothetical protein